MGWGSGVVEWTLGETAFVSAVFSWNAQKAYMRCKFYQADGYNVRCGGQAVYQNPALFAEFDTSGSADALMHHNPQATFTSRGCIRRCSFCLVPILEGGLVELDHWEVRPIVCDNNLLATSGKHFDSVVDRLVASGLEGIDFNQGLDARLLTDYHAGRLAELPPDTIIRLAWDNIKTEKLYLDAFGKLREAGIRLRQIRTYVLIGYEDTPEDALYRLETVRGLRTWPNPMRYQPLDSVRKNQFVGDCWTDALLTRYMRYWSNLRYTGGFSFAEYERSEKVIKHHESQLRLDL